MSPFAVEIDTQWNVNIKTTGMEYASEMVEIDTQWNVNILGGAVGLFTRLVEIDTQWNVNQVQVVMLICELS